MILVALFSSAQGVLIPQVIGGFGLSLSYGGLLVALNQSASVFTMLATGWLVDRFGAVAVLLAGIGVMAACALSASFAPVYALVALFLWAMSIGSSSTAAATNALMAQTGERRGFYLGMMHSTYSLMSIGVPLLAGWVVAWAAWRDYYRLFFAVASIIGLILWRAEKARGRPLIAKRERPAVEGSEQKGASILSALAAEWRSMAPLYPVCLGVFFMAGTQAALATWGYSYMVEVYQSPHALAAAATSLFWAGVLAGRVSAIPLSARLPERTLLVGGSLLGLLALGVDWSMRSAAAAMAALAAAGYGVSGAFQLGTSWAAALAPQRIGVASGLIMASASLGGLALPAGAALIADRLGFEAFRWLLLFGYLVSAGAFARAAGALGLSRSGEAPGV